MRKKGKQLPRKVRTLRKQRIFSDTFKKARVKEFEQGLLTVREISTLYKVCPQAVYKWLYKYSATLQKGTVQVVQMESEFHKTKQLLAQVKELEAALGRKQLEVEYLEKLISLASSEWKVDLKKNFATKSSSTTSRDIKKEDTK